MPKGKIPVVMAEPTGSYMVHDPKMSSPIPIGSPEWFEWLQGNHSFRFEGFTSFTAMRERRKRWLYWYAYARVHNSTLRTAYLGKSEKLTLARLLEVGQKLQNADGTQRWQCS